jgi:hypothetical protein
VFIKEVVLEQCPLLRLQVHATQQHLQEPKSKRIKFTATILPQGIMKHAVLRRGVGEQSHAGPKLQMIRRIKNLQDRTPLDEIY